MDSFEIAPETFAELQGLDRGAFLRACRKGVTKYAGWPVGDWVVREDDQTVSHLEVPVGVVERLFDLEQGALSGDEGTETASDPSPASDPSQGQKNLPGHSGPKNGAGQVGSHFREDGTPVSAEAQVLFLLARGSMSVIRALRDWLNSGEGTREHHSQRSNQNSAKGLSRPQKGSV